MNLGARLRRLRQLVQIHGPWKAASIAVDWLVNRFLVLDAFVVVVLDREKVHRPRVVDEAPVSFRLARPDDVRALSRGDRPLLAEELRRAFVEGDACLLQFVGDELAGYTWAHDRGAPLLIPGLRLKIPEAYVYNYASLTLPPFRGRNHQALRHHQLLQDRRWQDRAGLLGYVKQANWSSRSGLRKSGYRELGRIWVVGLGDNVATFIPPSLRRLGIERVDAHVEPMAELQRAIEGLVGSEATQDGAPNTVVRPGNAAEEPGPERENRVTR